MPSILESRMRKLSCMLFLLILFSCGAKQVDELSSVKITLSKDSQSIILKGLRPYILDQLKTDSLPMQSWQSLMGIYKMPPDSSLLELQEELPGNYKVQHQQITFKPDIPFVRGETYFCRFYGRNIVSDPVKVLFQRQLPDKVPFPEATFHIK